MSYFMIDVESDGPIPSDYSMISFGAVVVRAGLKDTFRSNLRPISERYEMEALQINGITREESLTYPDNHQEIMSNFESWILKVSVDRPIFIADNNGFDWGFINWYFHHFLGRNPFGYSSRNLGDLFKGFKKSLKANFKKLRETKHDHNPLNDAMGNAEALLKIQAMGLWIDLK